MERAGHASQTTTQPERPQMRDNLYSPRQDGDEYSSLPGEPRKTSLFLAAQMHPLATAALLAGLGAALALALRPTAAYGLRSRRRGRRTPRWRLAARPPRRLRSRHLGNGDAPRTTGPGLPHRAEPERRPPAGPPLSGAMRAGT